MEYEPSQRNIAYELLRSLSEEEYAKVEPLTYEQISEALESGRREMELFEKNIFGRDGYFA
ncbi:MAG: hypothetical protein ABIF88_02680 [archaeon]